MFHTVAYLTAVTATADLDGTAVTDSQMTIQNGHFVPQQDMNVIYAYTSAVTLLRGRLNSPTLRQISPPFIRPIGNTLLPASRTPVADYRDAPLIIKAFEELQTQNTDSAAGPNNCFTILGLQIGGRDPAPTGSPITMRGTATTTLVAAAWTQLTVTWADTLPTGQYSVVGLSGFSATGIAMRLIFEQPAWRPGVIIGADDTIIPHRMFLGGGLGRYGTFSSNRMPNVEVLANAADTAQSIYLEIVRVG